MVPGFSLCFFPSFFPYHALIASMAQAVKADIARTDTASGFLELLADREMGRVSAKRASAGIDRGPKNIMIYLAFQDLRVYNENTR